MTSLSFRNLERSILGCLVLPTAPPRRQGGANCLGRSSLLCCADRVLKSSSFSPIALFCFGGMRSGDRATKVLRSCLPGLHWLILLRYHLVISFFSRSPPNRAGNRLPTNHSSFHPSTPPVPDFQKRLVAAIGIAIWSRAHDYTYMKNPV